jgi:dTDP-glucose 4,6-dehydratase
MRNVLITGGCGFIGSNLVRYLVEGRSQEIGFVPEMVVNIDKLTYAGHEASLEGMKSPESRTTYSFFQIDVADSKLVGPILKDLEIDTVIHLAAETHVDRSIEAAQPFLQTNVMGTFALLETCLRYWQTKLESNPDRFRFVHVSTDEVFGSLAKGDPAFTEERPYRPNSPYAASKAAADHLVRSFYKTHGLPAVTTNCSNNYGPYQFPEKLIPLTVLNALESKPLPIYGKGENIRDWLHVQDHCRGLMLAGLRGAPGETYLFGGAGEHRNIEVVDLICKALDELAPRQDRMSYKDFKLFVDDRPGHDLRYAINAAKAMRELKWSPQIEFEKGLKETVAWYVRNGDWCKTVQQVGDERRRRGLGLQE